MKFLLSLPFIILPSLAVAEATGGYSYGDDSVVVVAIIAAVALVAFFMFRRRK